MLRPAPLRLIIDASALARVAMSHQELRGAARQIALAYGICRARAPAVDLSITGVGTDLRDLLVGKQHAAQWRVRLGRADATAECLVGDSQAILALSPDANCVLELAPGGAPAAGAAGSKSPRVRRAGPDGSPSPFTHIVLFPIVDRTVRLERGLCAARLPIREHAPSCRKPALALNQVVQALADRHGGVSWDRALRNAIPGRVLKL